MAIPSSGNIRMHADVRAEFGANTRPSPFKLTDALDIIFGSGRTEDGIRDFAGLSTPTNVSTNGATNITADSATLNGAVIGDGGVGTGWYYFAYSINSNFSGASYTSHQQFSGSVDPSANISGLDPETTYYFKLMAYNGFNADNGANDSADHTFGGTFSFETGSACAAPTSFTATEGAFNTVDLTWNSSHNPTDGWEIQYRLNFGNWNLEVDDKFGSARSHTDNTSFSNGDIVEYRIKAQCDEGVSESDWAYSNSVNF